MLPESVKYVLICGSTPSSGIVWPNSVILVETNNSYNAPVKEFPKSAKHLRFGTAFDQYLETSMLPLWLESITFGFSHRSKFNLCGLDRLKVLRLGETFNVAPKHLVFPKHLERLYFGDEFNQPINDLKLPRTLRVLKFGMRFNFPVECLELPDGLTRLMFGSRFAQDLERLKLPSKLEVLGFQNIIRVDLSRVSFPTGFRYVLFSHTYDGGSAHDIPKSVTLIRRKSFFATSDGVAMDLKAKVVYHSYLPLRSDASPHASMECFLANRCSECFAKPKQLLFSHSRSVFRAPDIVTYICTNCYEDSKRKIK